MLTVTVGKKVLEIADSERQRTEIFDRVVGYYRPITEWNIGKQQEFRDRIRYGEGEMLYEIREE